MVQAKERALVVGGTGLVGNAAAFYCGGGMASATYHCHQFGLPRSICRMSLRSKVLQELRPTLVACGREPLRGWLPAIRRLTGQRGGAERGARLREGVREDDLLLIRLCVRRQKAPILRKTPFAHQQYGRQKAKRAGVLAASALLCPGAYGWQWGRRTSCCNPAPWRGA